MDFTQALDFSLFDHPVYGTTHLSSTNYVGSNSDILIFSNYLQFGYSMKIALRHENKEVKGFKFGLQLLRGNNIRGYTVSVKYEF